MLVREVLEEERISFNQKALHPLQSWEWGLFKESLGQKVIRLGVFEGKKLLQGFQVSIHSLPRTDYSLLYLPKSPLPEKIVLEALKKVGREEKAIFLKMEPQIQKGSGFERLHQYFLKEGCRKGKSLFPAHTFWLDLKPKEEELISRMHPKTRYNLRLSQKKGVEVLEDNSSEAFETFLKLHFETTKREGFYSHAPSYHRKMWQILKPTGMVHLLLAKYQGKVLVAWLLFHFNQFLYYPYGGSSREFKEVMPSYSMMWEAIKLGKKLKCHTFDLWGTPGPDPKPSDPWFGFHRFKMGFSPQLVEFIGTYDLILNPTLYPFYNLADSMRWLFLRSKARLSI